MKYIHRKVIPAILAALIAAASMIGCAQNTPTPTATPTAEATPAQEPDLESTPELTPEPTPEDASDQDQGSSDLNSTDLNTLSLMTGLGVFTDLSKSASAGSENGQASATTIIASILTDPDGLILKCDLDSTLTTVPITANGQLKLDKSSVTQSKALAGEAYGMASASSINKEWNEQAKAFADWCVSKTVSEVKGMSIRKSDSGGIYPDEPDLASSVTIDIGGFLSAIYSASDVLAPTELPSFPAKTGLGILSTINSKSADASTDANGLFQLDTTTAYVSLDDSGRILSCRFDAVQPKISITGTGDLIFNPSDPVLSKQMLKENYGMINASSIGKEWYQQAEAFSEWVAGKTIGELKTYSVQSDTEGITLDAPELASTVTMAVGDFLIVLEKAVENAQ